MWEHQQLHKEFQILIRETTSYPYLTSISPYLIEVVLTHQFVVRQYLENHVLAWYSKSLKYRIYKILRVCLFVCCLICFCEVC